MIHLTGETMNKKTLAASCAALCATSTLALADPPKEDGLWRGALSASLAVASGNTQSTSFSIGADGVNATKEDKLSVFLTSFYAERKIADTKEKTANRTRAGLRYDRNLSDRTFIFGLLEAEQDKIADLDSRILVGTGFGYKVIKEKDTTFDIFGGVSYKQDRNKVTTLVPLPLPPRLVTSTKSSNATELVLGEESSHKISDSTSFKQKLTVYPNMTDGGKYRAQFDAGFVTAIASGINVQITLSNRYNSDVPAGVKKSDTLLLTGINIALGPK
jgi:putative salt-induced outer membrane protein